MTHQQRLYMNAGTSNEEKGIFDSLQLELTKSSPLSFGNPASLTPYSNQPRPGSNRDILDRTVTKVTEYSYLLSA
jgi:hypothetical protein